MGDRCTGFCCRRFPLSAGLPHIRDQAGRFAATHPMFAVEAAMIADMVIYAGEELRAGEYVTFYTCKHLRSNGDCGAYGRRPTHMCGDYPYGKPCEHGVNCAWDLAREGYHAGRLLRGLRRIALGQLKPRRRRLEIVEEMVTLAACRARERPPG